MRAQSAVEYFIIAGMVLVFMIPVWVYMTTTQQETAQELALSYTRNAAKQIADAASLVHSQGSPAKINIKVYIPKGVENVTLAERTVLFKVRTGPRLTEVWYTSNAPLQGGEDVPLNEGYYYFDVISHDTYVEVNRTY